MAYEACCVKSSEKYCQTFYNLRPIGECQDNAPLVFATLCCDPYIMTLDERGYTFNGWGEYTMVTASSLEASFTLQARTDLAETETGKLGNATVFTAFGAEADDIRIFVGLDPNTKSSLVIYANSEDFSRRFQNDPEFQVDNDDFFLHRDNDSLEISFQSGISLKISVRIKSLAMSLSLPKTFRNKTKGLMGNFNGIKDDEFILPDGTSMGPDPTERHVFQTFGPAWAVTSDSSVMRYEPREGPHNYSHPEFVPLFLDEQPEEIRNLAKTKCGDNLACQFDYFATGSNAFAMDSKIFQEDADKEKEALKNALPRIHVPSVLKVAAGRTVTFNLNGSDTDGDPLTYHIEDDGNGRVQVKPTSGEVSFLADTKAPVDMRFYVMDSKQLKSPSQSVEVLVCGGCSGHGSCDYSSIVLREPHSYMFHRVECICNPGWEGDECEIDRDDCANHPCMEGQTCNDLTPRQQGFFGGFFCGQCPAGFTWSVYKECQDVNECETKGLSVCQMTCLNTYGSFECGCQAGYRLQSDGRSCIDINECQEKTSNCQQICTNTVGGYQCGCEDGFTLEDSGKTCKQVDKYMAPCMLSECTQGCKPIVDPYPIWGEPAVQCFCFAGYDNIAEDGSECKNHDECQDTENPCSQRCYDYDGGFSCSCYDGYYLAKDEVTCLPCSDWTYGPSCLYRCLCSGHGVDCDNVKGCVCENGWRGGQCQEDIDECTDNPNVCGSEEVCFNTPGSFDCRCLGGYEKDSRTGTCSDVDECSELASLNTCGEHQRCSNVPGSFFCTCVQGYKLSNGQCEDIDECALGISDCEHQCINLPGSYNCECRYGYRLNTDRATCSQVSDVCAAEKNLSCDHGCTLNDEDRAVCFCKVGFLLDADRQTCNRVSTCDTFGCSDLCTNINNKPVCSCPSGKNLDLDLKTCHVCPQGTFGVDCANNCSCGLGALQCNATVGCVCKDGWAGEKCDRDINECDITSVLKQCQAKQAVCQNAPGSYTCSCRQGYEMNDQGICQDIDECRTELCGQQCENSPGSYRCLCSRGFTLEKATEACKDIDECAFSATNLCEQACINTPGKYRCACSRPGFTLRADSRSCRASEACRRSKCPKQNGGCSKGECFCNNGYQLSGTNTCDPVDMDWCSQDLCEQECQETSDGSTFLCSCWDGYILNDDKRTCRRRQCTPWTYGSDCSLCTCVRENAEFCDQVDGTCLCKAGWEGITCIDDVDECTTDITCQDNAECSNTEGSYVCICNTGFFKGADGICTECTPGRYGRDCNLTCDCQSENTESCDNVDGTCTCKRGWTGSTCSEDIDECSAENFTCPANTGCNNTVGSYVCQCHRGFFKQTDDTCIECTSGNYGPDCSLTCDCDEGNTAFCDKVGGSCFCKAGWKGNACTVDIDECTTDNVTCPVNSECSNTMGSYVCRCNTGYSKHTDGTCKKVQASVCGGTWTSTTGTIKSPNFPSVYNNSLGCVYVITVPDNYYISLSFTTFKLEVGYDFVEVHDGGSDASPIFDTFTGSLLPFTLRSSQHQMWINLRTDVSVVDRGFIANYTSDQLPSCGGTWMARSGVLQSPNFPNPFSNGLNCLYTIIAPVNNSIVLDFTAFDLETNVDFLEVRNAMNETIGRFSGGSLPGVVRLPENQIILNFNTESSVGRFGFEAHFTSLAGCGGIWTSLTGRVQSPNFPSVYPNLLDCVYIIKVPSGHNISLTFTAFHVEQGYDFVEINDGGIVGSLSLGHFDEMPTPHTLNASSNQMWIYFHTDTSVTKTGFSADYTSVP
ncbi:fibrillin-3-like [Littorina saxatilis]|uniref:fibrillin-3-like n=1 Tax=Littorina saxatilis TaxID=31220 RepID=UPI0038B5EC36